MGAVRNLDLDERVHVDGQFLVEVVVQLGPVAARDLIGEALDSIAAELQAIACLRQSLSAETPQQVPAEPTSGLADLVRSCDRLSRIAWELGLTTLSGVAVDLGLCAERGDQVALPAVEARLQRVGRGSLCAAWAEAAG